MSERTGRVLKCEFHCAIVCAFALVPLLSSLLSADPILHKKKPPPPLGEILRQMNDRAKGLKTVSANLEYKSDRGGG